MRLGVEKKVVFVKASLCLESCEAVVCPFQGCILFGGGGKVTQGLQNLRTTWNKVVIKIDETKVLSQLTLGG